MSWYITPDQYAEAKANGISYKLLTERVRVLGWDIRRAMTEPRQRQRIHGSLVKWVKIAKANGIGRNEFYSRINKLGWPLEKAATTPILNKREVLAEINEKRRKYPKEYYDLAEANGISRPVFFRRVSILGWPLEKAATTPIMTRSEAGKRGGKVLAEKTSRTHHGPANQGRA